MCYMLANLEENSEESIGNESSSYIRSVDLQSHGWLCILLFLSSDNSMKALIDTERAEEERKYANTSEKLPRLRIHYSPPHAK